MYGKRGTGENQFPTHAISHATFTVVDNSKVEAFMEKKLEKVEK